MPKVKVWNDNTHDHTEKFKDKILTVPAKGYIEMEYLDAVDFKGQYTPIKLLGTGAQDPAGFKMIRVEPPKEDLFTEDKNVFHGTGKQFSEPGELIAFAKAYAAQNPDLVAPKNPEVEDGRVSMSKQEFETLVARVNALESEKSGKRPPGRPRKEAAG